MIEDIGVCHSYDFVRTAKESIICDMEKLCGMFFSIKIIWIYFLNAQRPKGY